MKQNVINGKSKDLEVLRVSEGPLWIPCDWNSDLGDKSKKNAEMNQKG